MQEKKRILVTLPTSILKQMEFVYGKYGLNKSNQISNLVIKYLEREYGEIQIKGEERGASKRV